MGCRVRQARLTLLWGRLGGAGGSAAASQLPHTVCLHWAGGALAQGEGSRDS